MQKYGIPLQELPAHCLDAVDAAERSRARTLVTRQGQAIAAIVPMTDLDAVDPPDPGAGGVDPLLALCGACRDDDFVEGLLVQASLEDDFDPATTEEDMQATRVIEDMEATRSISAARIGKTLHGTGPTMPPGGPPPPAPVPSRIPITAPAPVPGAAPAPQPAPGGGVHRRPPRPRS